MGFVSQLIASGVGGAIGGSFVMLGVNKQFRRQGDAALGALRIEINTNEAAAAQMVQAVAAGGPTDRFEAGKADPSWLHHSIWDSQLPFFVQRVDPESLARLSEAYSTLEAVPNMVHKDQHGSHRYYDRGGWIDVHINKIREAFLSAQQQLDRSQGKRDSEDWSARLRDCLPPWLGGNQSELS
jgi:hypothetical protein